jgi:protein CWC15
MAHTRTPGKQTVGNSRQYSSRDMAGHTKLKFRQPGQGTTSEVARKDLRAELARAETKGPATDDGDEQASKRRRILEEAKDLDMDDEEPASAPKAAIENGDAAAAAAAESSGDDDDDSDEDETAELLRELEKIKRERAEEKDRQVSPAADACAC